MIYVGIDDTDTLDDPGTNQLARHIVRQLADEFRGRMVLRHQLLEDPRVPCTKKNGCASILLEPSLAAASSNSADDRLTADRVGQLTATLRRIMIEWCPKGSDPGLCVATSVPSLVVDWGLRCKQQLVTQAEARQLADQHGIYLEGLGGTEDGVIGALAAIGLMATKNDGRVIHFGGGAEDWYDVTGILSVHDILQRGVNLVQIIGSDEPLTHGSVDVGKRLRPNFRNGQVVLYVSQREEDIWEAVRVV